ncbi:hypothetical protein [Paenibacillus sp. OV219]|uniref:hypothetical protein n=1 Tax=Paenibacillus sp. OV219 TaxID=1884377 RepID=UPI0015A66751|nr:hypothetical protein [Paenibacillus sp. OV219]
MYALLIIASPIRKPIRSPVAIVIQPVSFDKLLLTFIVIALLAGLLGGLGAVKIKTTDTAYSKLFTDYGSVGIGDLSDIAAACDEQIGQRAISNATTQKSVHFTFEMHAFLCYFTMRIDSHCGSAAIGCDFQSQ